MRELRAVLMGLIALIIAVNVASGQDVVFVREVTALLSRLAGHLKTILTAVAVPALLAGGLLWLLSPWRRIGERLTAGAIAVLVLAQLGPPFLDWLSAQMAAYGPRLFGGRP